MADSFVVLEIAGDATAPCGRLLAEAGAEVTLVEPPGGAARRRREPLLGPPEAPVSAYTLFHDRDKRALTLDLDSDAGRAAFLDLAAHADVVLESAPPGTLARRGLDYETLRARQPGLVLVSITPFGQDGPYRDYAANDLVAFAMGGLMFISGVPGQPPVVAPDEQGYNTAATHAALAALWGRRRTGQGDWIDVSVFECLAAQENTLTNYLGPGRFTRRNGSQHRTALPGRIFPAADGFIHLYVGRESHVWARFLEWLGHPPALTEVDLADINRRWERAALVDELTERFTRERTRAELFDTAQALHIPCVPVYSPADYLADAHTTARELVVAADHPTLGRYRALRPPLELRPPHPPTPSPTSGEGERASQLPPRPLWERGAGGMRGAPLAGVRVCAFTHVAAGPYGCLQLAYLGAEVVKVESSTRIDTWRFRDRNADPEGSRTFADHNKNVRSVALDLKHPEGQALARQLIAASDAVVDNYSVGVMDRLGLGYEAVRQDNPRIIVLHMAGLGATGPRRHYVTFGPSVMSISGVTYLWNHPDQPMPVGSQSSYPDYVVGVYAAYAVVAALHRRERTGVGQLLDLAQAEVMAHGLGPSMLAALNGQPVEPRGNTGPDAPHGCYPCAASDDARADDAWCVIAVENDAQWAGLRRAMGSPVWAAAPEYATSAGRRAHAAALDAQVADWTRQRSPREVMERCQAEGVPAGIVATGEDLYHDPHLAARGFMLELEHPRLGLQRMPGPPVRLRNGQVPVWRLGPLLGEDTDAVLAGWLGLTATEIEGYRERGALR